MLPLWISYFDPKRPFTLGMVVVCNADHSDIRDGVAEVCSWPEAVSPDLAAIAD